MTKQSVYAQRIKAHYTPLTKNHSLYWSFQTAFQPSGTLGGGGPYATLALFLLTASFKQTLRTVGGAKSAILCNYRQISQGKFNRVCGRICSRAGRSKLYKKDAGSGVIVSS
jgi:hypothetical protein